MDKRKLKAISTPADIEKWTDTVLKLPRDEIVKYIVDVADQAGIKITDDDPEGYPSFSVAKWPSLAEKFGLASCFENNVFERVITPVYNLPPSVHEDMFEAAWRSQDVYQELPEQRRQITRLRIMDPVCDFLFSILHAIDSGHGPLAVPCSHFRNLSRSSN